jgi:uncharacterized membrane protein YeaQ/YmgE (transglycosylase-associated protein family)
MQETQVGWIATIIVGGIAGWLAEKFMHSDMGVLMDIVLGIIGAAIAGWLFGLLGVSFGAGWLGEAAGGAIYVPIPYPLAARPRESPRSLATRTTMPRRGKRQAADLMVAVGTRIAPRPPHRSRRALLTHRAPPSGFGVEAVTWQRV